MRLSIWFFCLVWIGTNPRLFAQEKSPSRFSGGTNPAGTLTLGMRTTLSHFTDDGSGLGTGGQFRLRLSPRVNTDWFADYITVPVQGIARSDYVHIGWSVMYYLAEPKPFPTGKFQPFILAGHCFDYNKKTIFAYQFTQSGTTESADRWGSAIQTGLGFHVHLSPQFEVTLKSQYMIHLTSELELVRVPGFGYTHKLERAQSNSLEGHLLSTISLNYSIARLWGK